VSQVRRQSIGGEEQRAGKQNTQCFHTVTLAFSEFYEIGSTPFLLSVFGLQGTVHNVQSREPLPTLDFARFNSVIANHIENPQ
jgi:hypothetical protein